jgi:hypothetical protein
MEPLIRFFIPTAAGQLCMGYRLSYSLDQSLAVGAWFINEARDGVGVQRDVGTALEDVEDLVWAGDHCIKPGFFKIPVKNHGHAVMKLSHKAV